MRGSNISMVNDYCGALSKRIKVQLFESDRQWLADSGIEYSDFIRATCHARIAILKQLPTVTPRAYSTYNKLLQ
jgi:hypothetical protein